MWLSKGTGAIGCSLEITDIVDEAKARNLFPAVPFVSDTLVCMMNLVRDDVLKASEVFRHRLERHRGIWGSTTQSHNGLE